MKTTGPATTPVRCTLAWRSARVSEPARFATAGTRFRCALASLVFASIIPLTAFAAQPDDDPHDDGMPPGLEARFDTSRQLGGVNLPPHPIGRIDPDIQFNWTTASHELRVRRSPFSIQWRGSILVPVAGQYTFQFHLAGETTLKIDGREVVRGTRDEPGWLVAQPITLEFGHHPIEVDLTTRGKAARIGLFWESRTFGLEPVAARWLFHKELPGKKPAVPDWEQFEHGHDLVRAYRCANCHIIPGVVGGLKSPSLTRIAGNVRPEWLVEWLKSPHSVRPDARMPEFAISRDDARAMAAYLLSQPAEKPPAKKTPSRKGQPETGEALVQSLGCLGCHSVAGSGNRGQFGGGQLDRVADKLTPDSIRAWLKKPEQLNPNHRMPVFTLSEQEVEDLVSYLRSLRTPDGANESRATPPRADLAERGKLLLREHHCAACHDIADLEKPGVFSVPLRGSYSSTAGPTEPPGVSNAQWQRSCLEKPDPARHQPGYDLPEPDRQAIRTFIDWLPDPAASQSEYELGRRLLRENNCLGCHARDLEPGLRPTVLGANQAAASEMELARIRGELEPPSLTAVGDKFRDDALTKLITGGLPPRRPWLKVRMPRFAHTDHERDAMLRFLIDHDRIPDRPLPTGVAGVESASPQPHGKATTAGGSQTRPQPPSGHLKSQSSDLKSPPLDPTAALAAGHQLVGSRGFGCMSCHTIGKHYPKGIAANARGSDLLAIGDRVRHEWFLRWVRDPARIVPGMEMPSISIPVGGLLDGRVETQIEALWLALNSPSFVVPSDRDTAQQIISLKPGDEPAILRDVMFDCPPGSGWCPRSFAIGLPNRHNVLFDLDTMSLRAWWVGDFARQRTEAKTWLWEPAGLPMWHSAAKLPSVALRDEKSGQLLLPEPQGQCVADLKGWMHGRIHGPPEAVTFFYAIHFPGGVTLDVVEFIEIGGARGGFERSLLIEKVPARYVPVLLQAGDSTNTSRNSVLLRGPLGQTEISNLDSDGNGWTELPDLRPLGDRSRCFELRFSDQDGKRLTKSYSASVGFFGPTVTAQDHNDPAPPSVPPVRRAVTRLDVVPGYEAIRLPLDSPVMPTAMAFRRDGTPVVCSLKGRLFLARDSDGDAFEDTWHPLSDHLAAPFGVLTDGNDLLVSHKPELLRLEDLGGDGRADFSKVVATGWGYTEDYHDWTFGPVRDSTGNLYIATASDYTHKDRPKKAQKWRGRMLKITPDGEIEELARGLRYPTGLAITRDDQIFFTDNQGVQNTFNEINHFVPGSRYGVPSLDDPPADKDPWPERKAAIEIPHPWTRSVNGICFLYADGKWGPFEGHGIGCEYDTRGLIRFTLQKVGDTYQGACYPFSVREGVDAGASVTEEGTPVSAPADPAKQFLGPICCAVSPNGDLYVGGLRDSGWGGGNNVGELVRIHPRASPPLGIREVRAFRDGLVIEFTGAVDAEAATKASSYTLSSYRRLWQGTYATPDSDRRTEKIRSVSLADDRRSVVLTLEGMRPSFVYDIHLRPIGPDGRTLWPAEAYYTLNQVPDVTVEAK